MGIPLAGAGGARVDLPPRDSVDWIGWLSLNIYISGLGGRIAKLWRDGMKTAFRYLFNDTMYTKLHVLLLCAGTV
jgi:hypothetical protein